MNFCVFKGLTFTYLICFIPNTLTCGYLKLCATAVAIALSGTVPAFSSGITFRYFGISGGNSEQWGY